MERRTIGAFLAVLRKANGMTQQQVADRLNVSNKTVSKWERDESLPDITLIPALAEMFHVTSDEILRGQRLEQGEQGEKEQEKQIEKTRLQAQAIMARTLARHLNGSIGAAAAMAVGLIALFTVSYAFYKPVLGFGIFMAAALTGLVAALISTNTARNALTGGEIIGEADALAAEKKVLNRTKRLISMAAVMMIWAHPLVTFRSGVYIDSVVNFSTYLEMTPVLAALSVLVWLLAGMVCVRIWPELKAGYERTERKLKRLYIAAGCALALAAMLAFAGMVNASRAVVTEARQTIWVRFDDREAYREYTELAEDCALGGAAWMDYCQENLAERGIPWKGEISDVDRDYLMEWGYLPELNEDDGARDMGYYHWAFYPGMQSVDGLEICFDMTHYRTGDSEAQLGIILLTLTGLIGLAVSVYLCRRRILRAERECGTHGQAMLGTAAGEKTEE